MGDTLQIRKIEAWARLGVLPEERLRRRPVVISLRLCCELARPGRTDVLADAVDYAAVRDAVVACVEASACGLLEHLAARIADVVLGFDGVEAVTVDVEKPNALDTCEGVAVVITRGRR